MKKVLTRKLLFTIFIIAFALFSFILSLYFISAQEGPTVAEVVFDPIKDLFTKWGEGNLNINIAKYLFFVLIALFVWSILDFSGVIPSNLVTWIVSFIVAFLSIAYVAPNQIWILLTSYEALGLTLIFLVPLIILGLFTLRVAAVGDASGVLFQYLMWIIYGGFLAGTFVVGMVNSKISVSDPFAWIYLGAVVFVALVVVFNHPLIKWIANTILKEETERAENILQKAVALRRMEAGALEEQSGARRRRR